MPVAHTARGDFYYKDYRARAENPPQPPLLLIHGAGGSYLDWSIGLRKRGAIALDLPGHGRSVDHTPHGRDSIVDYAADVAAFIASLELASVVVVGHSMGGAIVQQLALDFAPSVAGLVLVGTGAHLPVNDALIDGIVATPDETASLIMKWSWSQDAPDKFRQQGKERLLQTPPRIIQDDYRACDAFDVRDQLSTIAVPTLVVCGTADKMTPLALSQTLAEDIPQAQLITVEGAGHMLPLEQPDTFREILLQWHATTF